MSLLDFLTHDLHSYLVIKEKDEEISNLKSSNLNDTWTIRELKNKVYLLEKELKIRKVVQSDLLEELPDKTLKTKIEQTIKEYMSKPEDNCPFCQRELKSAKNSCMYCGWRK